MLRENKKGLRLYADPSFKQPKIYFLLLVRFSSDALALSAVSRAALASRSLVGCAGGCWLCCFLSSFISFSSAVRFTAQAICAHRCKGMVTVR